MKAAGYALYLIRMSQLFLCFFFVRGERKTGQGVRKIEVAEAKNQTGGKQRLANMGVARRNLPDQSTNNDELQTQE